MTVSTETVQLKFMTVDREFIFPGHHFLEPLDGRVFKFNDLSTPSTDQMVMVVLVGDIIIQCSGVTEMPLLSQPTVAKQIQCPVDRGQAYPNIALADLPIQVFCRDMVFAEEDFQNNLTLLGQL